MKIGFIGAGKVGFTLGKYFKEAGILVTGYYSRSEASAKEAAGFTATNYFETPEEVLSASDILFLTVPDGMISVVWKQLKQLPLQNKIICHCSGLHSSAIFDGIDQKQASGYSVHPLFAISSKQTSYQEIAQAVFTIEGDDKNLAVLRQLLEQLGNPVHRITAEQKIKYHCAAVFLSNHIAGVAYAGSRLLGECGFEEAFIQTTLKTLFLNNCKGIAEYGPVKALTGPIERNDTVTVEKHMNCLERSERLSYDVLSQMLVEIAKEKHPDLDFLPMEQLLKKDVEKLK